MLDLHPTVAAWYARHARALPWRREGTTPWGVLVSEVMSQQTPVARVAPAWEQWMERWPRPADLAAAAPADVLRAWQRLGYPRRALRLRECAAAVVERFGGAVPATEEELLTLPGVGAYTAAAVVSFAHGRRALVLDTNVRRVLARVSQGRALPPPGLTVAERAHAARLLPADPVLAVRWNEGVMELGALVCTARSPRCTQCPLADRCRWRLAGAPPDADAARRRKQAWQGSDRQVRGRLMARLRELPEGATVAGADLLALLPGSATDPEQPGRALAGLLADGLVSEPVPGAYALPT